MEPIVVQNVNELGLQFLFDNTNNQSPIIYVLLNNKYFQLQTQKYPETDFENLKTSLLNEDFVLSIVPDDIMTFEIADTKFQFNRVQEVTPKILNLEITELKGRMQVGNYKNRALEIKFGLLQDKYTVLTYMYNQLNSQNEVNNLINKDIASTHKILQQRYVEWKQRSQHSRMKENANEEEVAELNRQVQQLKEFCAEQKKCLDLMEQKLNQAIITKDKAARLKEKQDGWCLSLFKFFLKIFTVLSLIALSVFYITTQTNLLQPFSALFAPEHYSFSQVNKSPLITVSNGNLTATNPSKIDFNRTYAIPEAIVFTQQALLKNGSSIRLKIGHIGYATVIGMGIQGIIASKCYLIQKGHSIGDGCFVVGPGGGTLSHSHPEHNQKQSKFNFYTGDVVRIQTNVNELIFYNESRNKEFRMKISLTQSEWKQARFMVNLFGLGDSVTILNNDIE